MFINKKNYLHYLSNLVTYARAVQWSLCASRAERDLLREELEGAGARVQQLILEVSEAEAATQDQAALAAHNASTLEETLTQERRRRSDLEAELRQVQEVRLTVNELFS